MSDSNKSIFSGLHLAITGFAAFVTSVVAILGLALNQGWIGGHTRSSSSAVTTSGGTSTSIVGAPPGGPTSDTVTSDTVTSNTVTSNTVTSGNAPTFSVQPAMLVFDPLGPKDMTVSVKNTGRVTMAVNAPYVDGPDKDRFSVTDLGCASPVDPGLSCQVKLTFNPKPGTFAAKLVVKVIGATQAFEVNITAKSIF